MQRRLRRDPHPGGDRLRPEHPRADLIAGVSTAAAVTIGVGLTVACLLVAGVLRFPWGYWLVAVQVAAIAVGFQIGTMLSSAASSWRCGPRRTSWAAGSRSSAPSGSAPATTPGARPG